MNDATAHWFHIIILFDLGFELMLFFTMWIFFLRNGNVLSSRDYFVFFYKLICITFHVLNVLYTFWEDGSNLQL